MPRTFGKQSTNMDTNKGYAYIVHHRTNKLDSCKGTMMDEAELR